MTAFETGVRNELRGQSLGTVYSRQQTELFTPLVDRTFNILFRRGLYGVIRGSAEEQELLSKGIEPRYIPDKVVDLINRGEEVFKVTYISPAARVMQAEELLGIERMVTFAVQTAPAIPTILDNLDEDEIIRRVQTLTGAPPSTIKDGKVVQQLREARNQAQQAAAQQEQERNQSEVARNMAQAGQMVSNSLEGQVA